MEESGLPETESSIVDPAARPTRRTYPAEYRARVLAEYEAAPHGQKSAVLRREGIYQTLVAEWAKARDAEAAGETYHRVRKSRSKDQNTAARAVKLEPARDGDEAVTAESILDDAFTTLLGLQVTVVAACTLTGISRATHYRRVNPPGPKTDPIPHAERKKPPSTPSASRSLPSGRGMPALFWSIVMVDRLVLFMPGS